MVELKKKIDFKKQIKPFSITTTMPELKNKIDLRTTQSNITYNSTTMNQSIQQLFSENKSSIRFDTKNKGFTTITGGSMKANHFVAMVASKNNAVAVAYNTGYSISSMGFKLFSYNKLTTILRDEQDLGLYEVLDYETPRKIFFDIDFYDGTIELYEEIKTKIFTCFVGEGIDMSNDCIREYGYVGEKKGRPYVSYHIIVNNGFLCENQEHLKNLIDYMILKYPILTELIDCCVYNKFRNFRLPYQSKNGDVNAIQRDYNKSDSIEDYLIQSRQSANLYKKFNVNSLTHCISHKSGKEIKITKSQLKNTMTHTNYYSSFPIGFKVDLGVNDNTIEYIMKSIPNNEKVGYDVWLKVGMALKRHCKDKNINHTKGFDLWCEWTCAYDSNTNLTSMKKLYNEFSTNGYGTNTLVQMARIFNKNFDRQEQIEMPRLYEIPTNTFKNHIDCESRFLGDSFDFKKVINSYGVSIIKSPMGTGKTYGMRPILSGPHRILYLSCKRAFGNSIFCDIEQYGFKNYMNFEDKSEIKECSKILCSIESIKYCSDDYDYVIMDECETLFSNMSGAMIMKNNAMENLMTLSRIISNTTHLILMDAYVGKRTIDFVKENYKNDDDVVCVENTYTYEERTYRECVDTKIGDTKIGKKSFFKSEIMGALKKGLKIAVCSGSRTLLEEIEMEVKALEDKKKYLFYNKSNPLESGVVVNDEWDDIDLLMYSPTITAGISYNLTGSNKQFDKLFVYIGFVGNPLARDMIQAHKRVRDFKCREIVVCIMNIENLIQKDKLPMTMKEVKDTEKNFVKELYKEGVYTLSEQQDVKWVEGIYYNNILERNVNDRKLPATMKRFFKMENIRYAGTIGLDDDYELYDMSKERLDYGTIKDISINDYDEILRKIMDEDWENITDIDWDEMKKYRFKNIRLIEGMDSKVAEDYYNNNLVEGLDEFGAIQKSHNIHILIRKLDTGEDIGDLEWTEKMFNEIDINKKDGDIVEFKNIKVKKTQFIMDIFKRLELYNSDTNSIEINKEFNTLQLEKMIEDYKKITYTSVNKMLQYECVREPKNIESTGFTLDNLKAVISNVMKDEFAIEISPPLKTKKITVSKGVRKNVKTFKLAQYITSKVGEKVVKVETRNGFTVYRGDGRDVLEEEFDFLDEDAEGTTGPIVVCEKFVEDLRKHKEQNKPIEKVKSMSYSEKESIRKKYIAQYFPKILRAKGREEKNRLSREMNERIGQECKGV
tara:strand:+ start:7768 stop:11448 length:3681 start_codon:yes stop_codon:yes gene_type:complete